MGNIEFSASIDLPWTNIEPIRLGSVPSGLGTADRFLTVTTDDEGKRLRVDLYSSGEACPFEEAILWAGNLAVGFGARFHLINLTTFIVSSLEFRDYFGHLYPHDNCILVASGSQLFRVQENGRVEWETDVLGIDGVVVNGISDGVVEGEGEWDPPGGWKRFRVHLDNGKIF
jgi:hypothetical protein